ncbi:hypothetical protein AJ85_05020 [Alkalihalobacillus alcalophilus ATCC 27647 = CGMCC 1.3604]|uniref:Uncharacterized protein n=2 Tax=Alkalihalobacillus alcalophilus TaxID=1445 RepID=A0A094YR82_ALKAL|nr:hypothetical protein BALCAV_0218970 [Alkalihalobacillus alcalophilus ATCC 27647 = CGMCC 1.3604]THG91438.1 hypothetical protein AJ85_05020 [Alkalihalobacillus alcalophilus ATCC 27647 = CGMCC 1.3604]
MRWTKLKICTGVWVNGECSWLNEKEWHLYPGCYEEEAYMISTAFHKNWGIELKFYDMVSCDGNVFIRYFEVINHSQHVKRLQLLFHQAPYGPAAFDGVTYYSSSKKALIHSQNEHYTLVSANLHEPNPKDLLMFGTGEKEEIWKGKEGKLLFSPFHTFGQESMLSCSITLDSQGKKGGKLWSIFNEDYTSLEKDHRLLQSLSSNATSFITYKEY